MEPNPIYTTGTNEQDEAPAAPEEVMALLRTLEAAQAKLEEMEARRQAALEEALAPLQMTLAALEGEYGAHLKLLRKDVRRAAAQARAGIKAYGRTVGNSKVQAVYVRGRVRWDTACMERYAVDHPEVRYFRSVNEPTVMLRWSKCK